MNATDTQRWGILYCPRNGIRSKRKRWERLQKELDQRGVHYDFVQSEASDSVERLVTMLIRNGYKTIIVVGGDSALNDAVNCLMREESSVRRQVNLGVVPNGSLNDFARFWGFNEADDSQTVEWLTHGRIRSVDLGCLHYTDKQGQQQQRYFLNCVNIGTTADIMNLRQQTRRVLWSRTLSFISSVILKIFHRKDYKMRLRVNSEVIDRRVMTLCVGNAHGYGQTPSAVPYNGMLDVTVVYDPQVLQLFSGLWLLISGRFLNHRSVHPYRTRLLEVDEAKKALVGIDGRLIPTPVGAYNITVEQEVVNFLIPD
ncbi:MAG: lipid kinase [Prevotella sp.]|nr:lipid kinase [Prevotella sp.]